MRIGDHFIESGLLTQERLRAALHEQDVTREPLGRILVRNGFLQQKDLLEALRLHDPVKLGQEATIVPDVPFSVLEQTRTKIMAVLPDSVYVGSLSPPWKVQRSLSPYFPMQKILVSPVSPQDLDDYLDQVRRTSSREGSFLERLLREALNEGASDIHIMPRERSYTILFRRLGVRSIYHEGGVEEYQTLAAQIKDRSRMDIAERRLPQDGGFSIEHNGRVVDLRVAAIPTTAGETLVIRLLDPDRVNPTLDALGITRLSEFRKALGRADGICLICGPTGSGKTTTLNAAVREMGFLERAIYSIEDPVEYRIPYVGQVNINQSVGLDFARGVRAFMRADPDVIIVGEIRDLETARNAIRAAETGHLVIGTLHTGAVRGAITRMADIGIPDYELRYLLRGVLAQRLVRTVCPQCHGKGCEHCKEGGYTGRTLVTEVAYLPDVEAVDAVIEGKRNWPTMLEDTVGKYTQGVTTQEEIIRVFGEEARRILEQEEAA